jgi:hypothetical protein
MKMFDNLSTINYIFEEFLHYDKLRMNDSANIFPKNQILNKFYSKDNFDIDEIVHMKLNDMIHFWNINEAIKENSFRIELNEKAFLMFYIFVRINDRKSNLLFL